MYQEHLQSVLCLKPIQTPSGIKLRWVVGGTRVNFSFYKYMYCDLQCIISKLKPKFWTLGCKIFEEKQYFLLNLKKSIKTSWEKREKEISVSDSQQSKHLHMAAIETIFNVCKHSAGDRIQGI